MKDNILNNPPSENIRKVQIQNEKTYAVSPTTQDGEEVSHFGFFSLYQLKENFNVKTKEPYKKGIDSENVFKYI